MKEKTIKIFDLIPDNKNYNKGNEFGNSLIEKSLRKLGAGRSILLDKNNRIIAGNKTIENAGGIGLEDIQIVESDGKRIIAVKRMDIDLDSKMGREMALADNATAKANIEWDTELVLADWSMEEQKEWGLELDFKQDASEDDYEIPDEIETDIVLGDLFEIGQHRLLCGDSTKAEDVERLMNGEKANMVFTDPPYGMFLETDYSKVIGSKKSIGFNNNILGKKYDKIKGDNKDFTPELITTIFENFNYCKEIFIFGADYFIDLLPNYGKDGCLLVWNKRSSDEQQKAIGNCFELFWSKQKHKKYVFNFEWFGFLSKDDPNDARNRLAPSMKPVKLISTIIEWFKINQKLIVDLYIGAGSTMVAAHQLNRKCYGMEIEPKYCQCTLDRMLKLDPSLEIKKNGVIYENSVITA